MDVNKVNDAFFMSLSNVSADLKSSNNGSGNDSDDSSTNNLNDPNRFNAYLNRGSELWTHWCWLGGQGKMSLMRCNYCMVNKQLKNAPKCRRHLIKCPKTPECVRKYFEKKEIEATRVSALMRELRSKEIKFPRNETTKPAVEQVKTPVPTANDLKHLQQLQQQVSINNVMMLIQNGNDVKTTPPPPAHNMPSLSVSSSTSSRRVTNSQHLAKTPDNQSDSNNKSTINNILNNVYSPQLNNRLVKSEFTNGSNGAIGADSNMLMNDEMNIFCQQLIRSLLPPNLVSSESIDLSKNNKNLISGSTGAKAQKRKLSPSRDSRLNVSGNGNGNTTNKENKEHRNVSANNTVVINLDDVHALDEGMFFSPFENGHGSLHSGGGNRKKKRDSCVSNGFSNGGVTYRLSESKNKNDTFVAHRSNNTNGFLEDFTEFNSNDLEIVHDDLNDLLASALISAGINFDFLNNPFFQKFITQLVDLASANKSYRLPSADKLSTVNFSNLVRKFDYDTGKVFKQCDSIVVSIDFHKDNSTTTSNQLESVAATSNVANGKIELDVNLLISSSNVYNQLFYKTITIGNSSEEDSIKSLNNQIDSLITKIGANQVSAVIMPYDSGKYSDLIYSYLTACHSQIVPLTNSYQLFHHLLCDICKIPSIHNLLAQCILLFQELVFNVVDFQEENQNYWKKVFESDNLKLCKHLLSETSLKSKNTFWISLNLMLCWFLVAKGSIAELFSRLPGADDILQKIHLDVADIESFFGKISVLFNFLTPFINAIHLIETESVYLSDIVKIYFDVKLAINNNNFYEGINKLCDKTERRLIDCIINKYLQEKNFSRYFFLAYYLDPRYRTENHIEENEELVPHVYDTLFCYAQALDYVTSEDKKLIDSLEKFRNGHKLYGMQLLKCPKSPLKFWKHLRRFPASAKLASCAYRLLSISTRAMFLTAPNNDQCTSSLYNQILNGNQVEVDTKFAEKVLPIKSYLLSHCQPLLLVEDEEDKPCHNGKSSETVHGEEEGGDLLKPSSDNISVIMANVISSLVQYSLIIAKPFTSAERSSFLQTSN